MPLKEENGPSITFTCSPTSNTTDGLGRSTPSRNLLDDALGFSSEKSGLAYPAAQESR